MKKSSVIIIVIVIIILTGAMVYSYQKTPEEPINSSDSIRSSNLFSGPKIVVEPSSYDFGRVKYGDVSEYIFIVKNSGDQTLIIEGVTTSCACTSGEMELKKIEPGKEADLAVRFDPAIHKDDPDLGQLTRTVYIATNDSTQEEIEVKIYANVYK